MCALSENFSKKISLKLRSTGLCIAVAGAAF
jgi:hypothetical protein